MPRLSTIQASLLCLTVLLPQNPAPGVPARKAFEAATIRLNKEPGAGNQRRLPGGRYVVTKMPLRNLLRLAYGNATIFRPQDQILGGPGWIDSDRFDIDAKAAAEFEVDPDGVTREHLVMLRTLLEDSFKLKAHVESRDLPIYALVRLSPDRLGPQFSVSKTDCSPGAPPPADGLKCGITALGPGKGNALRGVPIGALVALLNISPAVDRFVRDMTNLTGSYDFQFYFAPPFVLGPGGAVPNPDVDSGPTVFTALQEQLGMKLDPRKGPLDVLVIEHIEKLSDRQ
jgi:uncharacterized protein (TIGR03435 family)